MAIKHALIYRTEALIKILGCIFSNFFPFFFLIPIPHLQLHRLHFNRGVYFIFFSILTTKTTAHFLCIKIKD